MSTEIGTNVGRSLGSTHCAVTSLEVETTKTATPTARNQVDLGKHRFNEFSSSRDRLESKRMTSQK